MNMTGELPGVDFSIDVDKMMAECNKMADAIYKLPQDRDLVEILACYISAMCTNLLLHGVTYIVSDPLKAFSEGFYYGYGLASMIHAEVYELIDPRIKVKKED